MRMTVLLMVFLLIGLLAVGGEAPPVAFGNTLMVDDDKVQCPSAEFTAIQAAVVAAIPGDTVQVCPGTYNENVVVAKMLMGQGPGQVSRDDCLTPTAADPGRDAIVQGGVSSAFSLQADDIVLAGFVVQNSNAASIFGALATDPAFSGYVIRDNLLQSNIFMGLFFRSSGAAPSAVTRNCFRTSNAHGINSLGSLRNALIDSNTFFQNSGVAITLGAFRGPLENVTITHNTSVEDFRFMDIFKLQGGQITHNEGRLNQNFPMFVRNSSGLEISHNRLRAALAGSGLSFGTFPDAGPSVDLDIAQNDIRDMPASGFHAFPNSVLSSQISDNKARDNGQDGIRFEAGGNSGNQITGNNLKDNLEHDCHDDTVGSGTAGTANLWEQNKGDTASPPGLCQ